MGFSKPKDTILNWTKHLGMPGMQTSGYVCMDRGTWWSMNCMCGDRCHQQLNTWWHWAWGPGGQPWLCSGVSHAWGECRRWSWCPDSSPLLCPADCRPSAGWTAPAAQGPAPWQSTGGQGKCDLHTQNCLGESDNTTQAECDLHTVTHRTALVSRTTQHKQTWSHTLQTMGGQGKKRPAHSYIQNSLGELDKTTQADCDLHAVTFSIVLVSWQADLVPGPWQSVSGQRKKRPAQRNREQSQWVGHHKLS